MKFELALKEAEKVHKAAADLCALLRNEIDPAASEKEEKLSKLLEDCSYNLTKTRSAIRYIYTVRTRRLESSDAEDRPEEGTP